LEKKEDKGNEKKTNDTVTASSVIYLARGDDGCATLKAAVSSVVFDVKLVRAPENMANDMAFVKGPILVHSNGNSAVFGGNGICKAICMLGNGRFSAGMDNSLEWEREVLRVNFDKGCRELEKILSENSGVFAVGGFISAADVAFVVTIHKKLEETPDVELPAIVRSYYNGHIRSALFLSGLSLAQTLKPAPPFPFATSPSMLRGVASVFEKAISCAFPGYSCADSAQRCNNPKHGDYQCNASMQIFQKLRKSNQLPSTMKTPQDVARTIIEKVPPENPMIENLSVNGPGFVLCHIKGSYLQIHANRLVQHGPPLPSVKVQKCVVDFSSPNIAKEMHVGHLRSTILGEAVCRILEFGGCEVERLNHLGDWGTQFGMLIQFLKEEYPNASETGMEGVNITDLTKFYKSAKERFDADPVFKKTAQENVVLLQSGDASCLSIWNLLCDISRIEFKKVYERLDVTLKECGESFYNDKIPPVIRELEEMGKIRIEKGGAKCVFIKGFKVPLMLQKSDGGFGYDSTDMAAVKYRLNELKADKIIYITDFSQGDHFKMIFNAAEEVGWLDKQKLMHIGFGTVQGEDGKRFKTRSGDTVRLVDLLDEAVERMKTSLEERMKENKVNITPEEIPNVAATLGYSAVKYFDLRRNPTSNYTFSYDRMLDTKGNTAIYLLYAHARLESICTKGKIQFNVDVDDLIKTKKQIVLTHPSEKNLALNLHMFADVFETTMEDLLPYHICDFLYNTSNAVSDFVTNCKVLGSPEMETRLLLCRSTAMVMRQCFDLLGIRYVMRI